MDEVGELWEGEGFGLSLRSSYRILGLPAGLTSRLPAVSLSLNDAPSEADDQARVRRDPTIAGATARSNATRGRLLRDIRHPDGQPAMSIERTPEGGFLILAPQFGRHLVDPAGAAVRSTPRRGLEPWRWQRLLIGQVLPLLAALHGHEVLHAAAVVVDGVAFGLLGDPGAGKSTLAASLSRRGIRLLSDDVLVVSSSSVATVLAHRGSLTLTLRPDQHNLASELVDSGAAEQLGSEDKQLLALNPAETPTAAPLGGLYLLSREGGASIGEPRVASILDLMRFSYIRYVQSPARLSGQLELQAGIANSVPVVPVRISEAESPAALAERLEAHMHELAATRLSR